MAENADRKSIPLLDIKAPFYAAVGAGDFAFSAVNDIVEKIRETVESTTSEVRAKVNEAKGRHLPEKEENPEAEGDLRELVAKFSPEELRKVAEAYTKVALDIFTFLAERGEEATKRLLGQADAQGAKNAVVGKLEEVRELTDEALGKVSSSTRALGEEISRSLGSVVPAGEAHADKDSGSVAAPTPLHPKKDEPAAE